MKKGFLFIFWGLIYTTFNFSIGVIDFFPNFIGFFLMYYGCKLLKEQNDNYKKTYKVLIYLTALSFIEYILFKANLVEMPVTLALSFVIGLCEIYILYNICRGIYELAEKLQLKEFANSVKSRMNIYLGVTVVLQIIVPIIFYLNGQIVSTLLIILTLFVIVVRVIIIITIYQAKNKIVIEE